MWSGPSGHAADVGHQDVMEGNPAHMLNEKRSGVHVVSIQHYNPIPRHT